MCINIHSSIRDARLPIHTHTSHTRCRFFRVYVEYIQIKAENKKHTNGNERQRAKTSVRRQQTTHDEGGKRENNATTKHTFMIYSLSMVMLMLYS